MSSKIQSRSNPFQAARANLAKAKQTVTAKATQIKTAAKTKGGEVRKAVKDKVDQINKQPAVVAAKKWGPAAGKVKAAVGHFKEVKDAHRVAAKQFTVQNKGGKNVAVFKDPIKQGGIFSAKARAAGKLKNMQDAAKTLPTQAPKWTGGVGKAASEKLSKAAGTLDKFSKLKNKAMSAGVLFKAADTVKKFNQANKSGKASDRSDARKSALDTAKAAVGNAKSHIETGLKIGKKAAIERALKVDIKKLQKTAPSIAKKLSNPKAAAKVAERAAANKMGRGALKTTIKVAERFGVKGAGRLIPGANVAMAGIDVASAINTQRDSRKTNWQKAAAWVTAGGSVAAATNIPIVSQVGAGVSLVSDAIGSFLPNKK